MRECVPLLPLSISHAKRKTCGRLHGHGQTVRAYRHTYELVSSPRRQSLFDDEVVFEAEDLENELHSLNRASIFSFVEEVRKALPQSVQLIETKYPGHERIQSEAWTEHAIHEEERTHCPDVFAGAHEEN